MRALVLLTIGALGLAVLVAVTRDPDQLWAVAIVVVALGVASGAIATMLQLRSARAGRRRLGPRRGIVARRGVEVAAIVALLLWLRAIDGLSVLTAAFVVGTFVVAEAILSARPQSSR